MHEIIINPGRLVSVEDKAALLANYSDGASSVVGSAAEAPTLERMEESALLPCHRAKRLQLNCVKDSSFARKHESETFRSDQKQKDHASDYF